MGPSVALSGSRGPVLPKYAGISTRITTQEKAASCFAERADRNQARDQTRVSREPAGLDFEPAGLDLEPVGLELKPVGLELEPAGLEFGPKSA